MALHVHIAPRTLPTPSILAQIACEFRLLCHLSQQAIGQASL